MAHGFDGGEPVVLIEGRRHDARRIAVELIERLVVDATTEPTLVRASRGDCRVSGTSPGSQRSAIGERVCVHLAGGQSMIDEASPCLAASGPDHGEPRGRKEMGGLHDQLGALRELVTADAQHRPPPRLGWAVSVVSSPDPTPAWYTLTFVRPLKSESRCATRSEPARNQLT